MQLCKSGKHRYGSEWKAHEVMTKIRKGKKEVLPKRIYFCGMCNGFHLTSRNDAPPSTREITNEAFKKYLKDAETNCTDTGPEL